MRGPGELLGTRQAGLPAFRVAGLPDDLDWLERARDDARELLRRASTSRRWQPLRAATIERADGATETDGRGSRIGRGWEGVTAIESPVRVLLVANTLPPRDVSGVGEQVLQLAAGLRDAGYEVEVLGRGPGGAGGSQAAVPALRRPRRLAGAPPLPAARGAGARVGRRVWRPCSSAAVGAAARPGRRAWWPCSR